MKLIDKTPVDILLHRGERTNKPGCEFASDPGDFGRGIYWTTTKVRAFQYGEVRTEKVRFESPAVMSLEDAYRLCDQFNCIGHGVSQEQRLLNCEALTKFMLAKGYDSLIAIDSRSDSLEIVDYRPYR